MTIQELKEKNLILFEAVSGSNAYGTQLPNSDRDIRGVFYAPLDLILSGEFPSQVSDETNDTTYYEISRFLELVSTNNPNVMELLNSPPDCILYKHPVFDIVLENRDKFISKQCGKSFGHYASTQIKKARGKNKKIVNPVGKTRKSPLDFCFVIQDNKTIPLKKFLSLNGYEQKFCGVANVKNAPGVFAVYYNKLYKGIVKEVDGEFISNELRLSSIPKTDIPIFTMTYNMDGYSKWCKDYKEYWSWVEKRNEDRYNDNIKHGKNYDSKNMMHCIRLIEMSLEILSGKGINVRRTNRDELLKIRRGEMDYDQIIEMATKKVDKIEELLKTSLLPERVDEKYVRSILVEIRKKLFDI
jgi:uncharacterized protein